MCVCVHLIVSHSCLLWVFFFNAVTNLYFFTLNFFLRPLQEFTHFATTFTDQKNFSHKKMIFADQILISREWSLFLATTYYWSQKVIFWQPKKELVAKSGMLLTTNYKFGRGRSHIFLRPKIWSPKTYFQQPKKISRQISTFSD